MFGALAHVSAQPEVGMALQAKPTSFFFFLRSLAIGHILFLHQHLRINRMDSEEVFILFSFFWFFYNLNVGQMLLNYVTSIRWNGQLCKHMTVVLFYLEANA